MGYDVFALASEVTHDLDEFEREDLPAIVRNQHARLQLQTGGVTCL